MSDKKVPSMGIKKRMSWMDIRYTHNEYPQSLRQHYLHQVRGYNLSQLRHPFVTANVYKFFLCCKSLLRIPNYILYICVVFALKVVVIKCYDYGR